MDLVTRPAPSWLTRPRVVGTPARWSAHGAALGASISGTLPLGLYALTCATSHLPASVLLSGAILLAGIATIATAVGAGVGGVVGLVTPTLLDGLRGRVPLPVIAAIAVMVGASAGAATALGTALGATAVGLAQMDGVGTVVTWCAGIGAFAAALWWLPFTIATVVGRRWPVTEAVAAAVPLTLIALMAALT